MKEKVFLGKGIRRVLSLMFCLAVCLILIPMTASAATDATPVTQVIIRGMERLYAGESVARDDLKKLITVSTTSSSTDISDAVNVDRVRWIDAETGKEATEIVEGHKYRLEVVLRTNANYYFEKDGTDSTKFGGRVFMYLSSMGASPYSVVLGRNYLLSVQSQEMTALPPAFTTQPVGGTNVAGKHFIINYETGSSDDRVYLESWDGDKWVTWDKEGQSNTTSFGVYTYYASGTTEKFRLRIDNGVGIAVYSDEFEVMWAVDYFTTQPVGGVFVCTKTCTITFAHADRKNNVQLQKYDTEEGKWQTMQNLGEATSYDIPGGKIHTKDTYRLEIVDGGGKGISVYSDEFEIMWADTTGHYATEIHLGAHQVYAKQGETYTTYVERGQHKYIEPNIWGIKAGTTDVEYAHRQIAITFLSEVTSSKTKAIENLYPEGLRIEVGEDEELDEIMIKVAYRVDPSIYAYLRIIVDEGGTIFYRPDDGSFKRTLNETASFNAPYKLQDYAGVIPPYGKVFKCWMYDGQEFRPGDTITFVKDPDDDDYINYVTAIYMDNPFTSKPNNVTIACNNPEAERTIAFNFTKTGTIEKVVLECDDVSTGGTFKKAYKSFDLSKRFSWGDDGNKALNIEAQTEWAGICRFAFTMNGVIYYSSSFRININPDCHVWQFLGITEYPTETTSGATYYRCTYCDQRKSVSYDGSFITAPRNVYVKDYGTETNGFAVSVPINGWTIEVKKNNKYETFLSSHAEESHAGGEFIEFTCGYDVDDVWPDENPYRIKVTVDSDGIIYSEPFVVTEAIKSVEVSDLDKPVAGETLDYDVTIRTNPILSDAIKATKIGWFMQGDTNRLETTVKAVDGQSYYCEIILTPKDGYGFESSEDGKYVNGVTCRYSTKPDTKVDEYGRLHIIFSPVKAGETMPEISTQPADITAEAGEKVTFSVIATGEGLTYQWQYKNASATAWSNSGAAAAKTANMTFTVGTDKTLNGRQYRCIVTDKNGKTVTSNAATLTVTAALAITSQPVNQTAAVGASVSFKVAATGEGLTYQWQYKNASATTWSNSGAAAAKTANMTFTVGTDKTLNGRQYRCIVKDKNGKTVTSNAATLTVEIPAAAITITSQPANQTAAVGEKVTFSVTATGEGLTYQWQYKSASASTWTSSGVAAAKTANMSFTVTDKNLSGRQYRCIVKDKNGNTVTSNAATLTVGTGSLAITGQPANQTAAVGEKVTFSVTATGEGLTYQWQYRSASASTWTSSGVAAAKTANMSFTVTDKNLNGRQYRCIVTDKNGATVTSNAVTLTVGAGSLAITSQPADVTAAVGEKVTFSVKVSGEGYTYQWQYKSASASTWTSSGIAAAKTANMSFTVTDKNLNGRQYRCIVTDSNGQTVTSSAATLTVQ